MKNEEIMKEVAKLKLNGCATVKELKQSCANIPDCNGLYFVLREPTDYIPAFQPQGTVLEHAGRLLSYPVDMLKSKWVENTQIIYIGKSDSSLRRRISTYINFGKGKQASHRGGRAIWQLPDADNLIMGWRKLPATESARSAEHQLIVEFRNAHAGMLPFANFKE